MTEGEGDPGAGVRRGHLEEEPLVCSEWSVEPHRVVQRGKDTQLGRGELQGKGIILASIAIK